MTAVPAPQYAGPKRILSGVQTSGALHLGNYLGALVKFSRLQNDAECLFFLADLHAITAWQDPASMVPQMRQIAAAYIASGVDPKRRSSSLNRRCTNTPNWPGYSTAWRGSAGLIA